MKRITNDLRFVLRDMNISARELSELLNAQGFKPNKVDAYKPNMIHNYLKYQTGGETFRNQVLVVLQTHLINQQNKLNNYLK